MQIDFEKLKKMLRDKEDQIFGYILGGNEYSLKLDEENRVADTLVSTYTDSNVKVTECIAGLEEGFYKLTKTWENKGITEEAFIFMTQVNTLTSPQFSLIPCVMYHENQYGKGNEPKGLEKEGKPWVFGYSRTGLPSATISESDTECVALFADTQTKASLISSCSLIKHPEGHYSHRLYYPEIELPVAYTNRDAYSEAIVDFITLKPGESFATTAYIVAEAPKYKNYGLIGVYDHASKILDLEVERTLSNDQIWERGIAYADEWLGVEAAGYSLFSIGCLPNAKGEVTQRQGGQYEIGWCGQNASLAKAFIQDGISNQHEKHLAKGIAVIDTWVNYNRAESGWVGSHFEDDLTQPAHEVADTCNLGWAGMQVLSAYNLLKTIGIEKKNWYDYAIGLCDWMCESYSVNDGFGKVWNKKGEMIEKDGTIGIFINLALLEAYETTKDPKYLHIAEKALRFYDERDLKKFTCTAGALDTTCVDKETCWPLMRSAIILYEITQNDYYKEVAERAGYYMLSWTYLYDVIYQGECDFKALGFRTKGATAVSAQHHHLDPWGALIAHEFERFYKVTQEEKWHKWAKMLWNNCVLCIADQNFTYKGMKYPYGAQGEASFHTNWGFSGDYKVHRGSINKWFVAWPTAFRLNVIGWEKDFLEKK